VLRRVLHPNHSYLWFCGPLRSHGLSYNRENHTAKSRCATQMRKEHLHGEIERYQNSVVASLKSWEVKSLSTTSSSRTPG